MKTIIKIVVLLVLFSSFLSCRDRDDHISTNLEVNFYQELPGSPERFGGRLYVYGVNYLDPFDIDVNYYKVEYKNTDIIYIPLEEFMILRDPMIKDNLSFIIIGPNINQYTHRPIADIYRISLQCHIRPYEYLTQKVTKNF